MNLSEASLFALFQRVCIRVIAVCPAFPMSSRDEEGEIRLLTPAELKQEAAEFFEDSKLHKMWSGKHFRHTRIAERFADFAFWIGVLSLIIFASVNVLEATLSKAPDVLYISAWK